MADVNTSNVSSPNVPASNPLSKKLNKILETRLDNDKVLLLFTLKVVANHGKKLCFTKKKKIKRLFSIGFYIRQIYYHVTIPC